ncbi:MAG TPA: response regulator transcription factor [Blastocatellia bacterium]|jgi:DNA-binding NarL/FixJ family response regulator|nr:response regulator transcription factor [Blastocatellia bacterium]
MDKTKTIRVLLAEDHEVVRDGLAAIIDYQADMTVVGHARNGEEAVERFAELQPDITLMDLRMPGMGGAQAIEAIRKKFGDARIIVLTTYDGDENIYRALKAGARGYLLKDSGKDDLLSAIRAVHEGRSYVPPEIATRLVTRTQAGAPLTTREIEVLQLMAKGKSNKEIGAALFISEGTVKTHVNSIHEKLSVSDRTEAVIVALKRGIIHL